MLLLPTVCMNRRVADIASWWASCQLLYPAEKRQSRWSIRGCHERLNKKKCSSGVAMRGLVASSLLPAMHMYKGALWDFDIMSGRQAQHLNAKSSREALRRERRACLERATHKSAANCHRNLDASSLLPTMQMYKDALWNSDITSGKQAQHLNAAAKRLHG